MKINIARIQYPVHSLGPGNRLVIWLQGCSVAVSGNACNKCISKDYWNDKNGTEYDIEKLSNKLISIITENKITGITISGGEPTDQDNAIIKLFHYIYDAKLTNLDWLIFSYFEEKDFKLKFNDLYNIFDALVLGEYRYDLSSDQPLVASSNQKLILRTAIARKRFINLDKLPRLEYTIIKNNSIEFSGIPRKDEMKNISSSLKKNGIQLYNYSWEN